MRAEDMGMMELFWISRLPSVLLSDQTFINENPLEKLKKTVRNFSHRVRPENLRAGITRTGMLGWIRDERT